MNTSQTLETNPYVGVGIRSDIGRSLSLIKQKEDKIINKVIVSKKRSSLEPRIGPVAKVISDISASQSNNEFCVPTVYVIYVLLVTDIMTEQYAVRRLAFTNKEVCYYYRDKVLMQY